MEKKKSSRKWLAIVIVLLFLVGIAVGCVLLFGGDRNHDDTLGNTTGTSQSGVSEPGISDPDVTEPDVSKPDATEPGVSEPDPSVPEVSEPEPTVPDVSEPEPSEPDESQPGDVEQRPEEDDPDAQKCAHTYGPWVIVREADCATAGTKSQTCSSCGDTKKQTINATGHSYSSWKTTKAATCELSGTKESTCANCGHTKTEVIAATGHKWDNGKDTIISTDCQIPSERLFTCTVCQSTRTEKTSAHIFGDWVWEDAIIQSGPDKGEPTSKKYHVCKKCNYKEYGNVPEHYCKIYCNGNDKHTIKGTCTKPNVGVEVCRTCGREWRYELGYGPHSWKSETRHLTDYTEYTNELDVEISTCTACGEKSCSYTKGKGWDTPDLPHNVTAGGAYAMMPVYDHYDYVEHPTWQSVFRNFQFDSNGNVTQYTLIWCDNNGNRYSNVVVCADIPKMFEEWGYEIPTGVSYWTYTIAPCYDPYRQKPMIRPDHISWSG